MAIPQAFVWGEGGARMTPEQIAQRRALARGLLKSDYSPVGSWAEGLARASGSWLGALQERQAGQAESANLAEDASARASLISALSGGDAAADPSIAPSAPAPEFAYDPSVYGAAGAEGGAGAIREGLIARGLPEHVADGFIMNFQDESGLNPGINEVNPLVPGSRGGFGLAQWTGPRRVALEEFAADRGVDVSDPNVQLDFLMSELQGPESRAAQSIMAAPDAGSAAAAIARDFLRPAPEHLERRVAQYGGGQQRAPGNIVAQALSAAGSPYASDATRSIANLIVQQQMQQNDPMRQLQMEQLQLKNAALRNPQPEQTAEMQNLAWRAREAGLQPGTPEYAQFMLGGGREGINVNVDTGTIPQGYQAVRDEQGRVVRYEPIPGGPADKSGADAAAAESQAVSGDIISGAARKAREAMSASGLLPTTGTLGNLAGNLAETNAAEVRRQVDVLKANARIETLQAMRAASPTGGALGNVSDSEGAMLAAKAGSLDPGSPNFARDLDDYERSLMQTIHGKEAGLRIFEENKRAADATYQWQDSAIPGVKIRRKAD